MVCVAESAVHPASKALFLSCFPASGKHNSYGCGWVPPPYTPPSHRLQYAYLNSENVLPIYSSHEHLMLSNRDRNKRRTCKVHQLQAFLSKDKWKLLFQPTARHDMNFSWTNWCRCEETPSVFNSQLKRLLTFRGTGQKNPVIIIFSEEHPRCCVIQEAGVCN